MSSIVETSPLGFPWPTINPFLFCAHHDDAYPAGDDRLGVGGSLEGRNIGQDFELRDGFRMYHGAHVPGFPQHPHRGFETVTLVRSGFVDHSDSLGATARLGPGDVQWITAGEGIVHAEMFPLVETDAGNRVELLQIWLNLPREDKLSKPHFKMMWSREIPRVRGTDGGHGAAEALIVAGSIGDARALSPPPRSWAARQESDVAIIYLVLPPGSSFVVPKAAHEDATRALYFFRGAAVTLGDETLTEHAVAVVKSDVALTLRAKSSPVELLLLQGRPIREPVAQHGPFVMNTEAELQQAFADYRRTRFGGWPWPSDDPVHPRAERSFARYPDGRLER